jgi:hypothetical protein
MIVENVYAGGVSFLEVEMPCSATITAMSVVSSPQMEIAKESRSGHQFHHHTESSRTLIDSRAALSARCGR